MRFSDNQHKAQTAPSNDKSVTKDALKPSIQRRKQADIIHLFGQIEYDDNYDYKKQRQVK